MLPSTSYEAEKFTDLPSSHVTYEKQENICSLQSMMTICIEGPEDLRDIPQMLDKLCEEFRLRKRRKLKL